MDFQNIKNKLLTESSQNSKIYSNNQKEDNKSIDVFNKTEFLSNETEKENPSLLSLEFEELGNYVYNPSGYAIEKNDTIALHNNEKVFSSAEEKLKYAKTMLEGILNNDSEEIQETKLNLSQKYETYFTLLNELNPLMAVEFKNYIEKIDELEQKRDEKIKKSFEKAEEVNEAKKHYDCCEIKTLQLSEAKSNIEIALSEIDNLYVETEDENELKKLDAQREYLIIEYENIKAQIEEAEAEKEKAIEEYKLKNEELNILEAEIKASEEELAIAKTEKENLEKEIKNRYPEIETVQFDYNSSKTNYDSLRSEKLYEYANIIKSIQNSEIEEIKDKTLKDGIENIERINRNIEAIKNYNPKAGENIANSAIGVVKGNFMSGGLCLKGVHDALSILYRGETTSLPIGYGAAAQTVEALRGNISGYEDIASNFVEVDISDPEYLKNLPAGAIVVWDKNDSNHPYGHVSISDGKGNEYSDFTSPQSTTYGTKFYVFIPVS